MYNNNNVSEHRTNSISSDQHVFDSAKPYYEAALMNSGYTGSSLTYTGTAHETETTKRKRRKRKILWFNPPFSCTVETNVGRKFLSLIDSHFPDHHPFHKFINRNCVKVSYSCMKNMESIIKTRNKQLLQQHQESKDTANAAIKKCNCRNPSKCPLDGKCLTEAVVYKATLRTKDKTYTYVGMTEGTFKSRYTSHGSSFRLKRYKTATKLSEMVWNLKNRGVSYTITWEIIRRGHPFRVGQSSCDLCTSEKLEILRRSVDPNLLNSRSELVSKCRHKRKFSL